MNELWPNELPPNAIPLTSRDSEPVEETTPVAPWMWRRLIEQADLCFQHAKEAERGHRFSAACGLYVTAQELLHRTSGVSCSIADHLVLERAVIERLQFSREELARVLELAVQVRLVEQE